MRYATVTLRWDGREPPVDPFGDDGVSVEAVRYVSPGPDGRYVELLDFRGNPDRASRLLADAPDVLEHEVTGTRERGVAYLQRRTVELVEELLGALHDHEIVLDWPAYPLADGRGLKLTVVGTNSAIGAAAAALPADVDLSLERTGEYEPDTGRLSGLLTERQLELFELAVREGYYEVPRETTHRELAAQLELATSTVSERLQRIEAALVAASVEPARR